MTYRQENINTLFAKVAECLARDPQRATRLLAKLKTEVNEALNTRLTPCCVGVSHPEEEAEWKALEQRAAAGGA